MQPLTSPSWPSCVPSVSKGTKPSAHQGGRGEALGGTGCSAGGRRQTAGGRAVRWLAPGAAARNAQCLPSPSSLIPCFPRDGCRRSAHLLGCQTPGARVGCGAAGARPQESAPSSLHAWGVGEGWFRLCGGCLDRQRQGSAGARRAGPPPSSQQEPRAREAAPAAGQVRVAGRRAGGQGKGLPRPSSPKRTQIGVHQAWARRALPGRHPRPAHLPSVNDIAGLRWQRPRRVEGGVA